MKLPAANPHQPSILLIGSSSDLITTWGDISSLLPPYRSLFVTADTRGVEIFQLVRCCFAPSVGTSDIVQTCVMDPFENP